MPTMESCDSVVGSAVSPSNGHCYRLNEAQLTFEEARAACERDAGHLLTVSSREENDFTRDLHPGEHWLGGTDGLGNADPSVGTYVWVTGEPWEFSDWESGQPNAFANPCPEGGDDHGCFEHCAFQTPEGDWNDRSCWHTIASICEWDLEPVPLP
jgi:Lectin C-type domain